MKLVIAGNYNQFRHHFRASYRDYKYLVKLPEDLRGLADTTLVLCGTYWHRKDYSDYEGEVLEYCRRHNISIKKLLE